MVHRLIQCVLTALTMTKMQDGLSEILHMLLERLLQTLVWTIMMYWSCERLQWTYPTWKQQTFPHLTTQRYSSNTLFSHPIICLTWPNLPWNKTCKVVLMLHPPRFDSQNVDPTTLKRNLVGLANSIYQTLWLNCLT